VTAPRATGRAPALAVAALTLVAALLRWPSLGRSLWLDEAWRANLVLAPSDAFWKQLLGAGGGAIGAPMPPLFALALRAVGTVVGHSALGMRALPVLASIAAVPLSYVIARRAGGIAAGLGAALLFAASPTALLHGQELKQYSTDVLVVLALLAGLSAVAARPSASGPWIMLALGMSVAPGLAFSSALTLPGIAVAALACCRDRADRERWLAAHVASGLAAVAWYVFVIGPQRARPLVTAYWAADFPPLEGIPSVGWMAEQLREFLGYAFLYPMMLGAVVVVAGLVLAERWLGIAALGSLLTLLAAAAARVYPLSGGRTTVFLLPFVYLGVGVALGLGADALPFARRPRALARIAFGFAAAILVVAAIDAGLRAPAAGIVYEETVPLIATLESKRQPADRVYVYDGAVHAFRFHHPASDPAIVLGGSHRKDPAEYTAELKPLLVPGTRLWLLFSHVYTPPGGRSERDAILGDLGVYGRQLEAHEGLGGASLHLYQITRAAGEVRHYRVTPEDLKNPERMKELLGR
jgi:hypothetical protein